MRSKKVHEKDGFKAETAENNELSKEAPAKKYLHAIPDVLLDARPERLLHAEGGEPGDVRFEADVIVGAFDVETFSQSLERHGNAVVLLDGRRRVSDDLHRDMDICWNIQKGTQEYAVSFAEHVPLGTR